MRADRKEDEEHQLQVRSLSKRVRFFFSVSENGQTQMVPVRPMVSESSMVPVRQLQISPMFGVCSSQPRHTTTPYNLRTIEL